MLQLFNTLTKKKEDFKPLHDNEVGMYTCGPTVYNYAHIGNLRTYVFEDILKRTLVADGFKVKHVMNITDVGHLTSDADTGEDKMEKGAQREHKTVWEIAQHYTDAFKQNLRDLNILEPDIWCKATDHINDQIALIKKIEKSGFAYETNQAVYFDVNKYSKHFNYSELFPQKLEDKQTAARAEIVEDKDKKHPVDFALWFKLAGKYKNHVLHWPSPWGEGFPGWHIECSAMSMKFLGETFDIHTGGIDHIPVHHTNEIAQSKAATGKDFVKVWLHGEFLIMTGRATSTDGTATFDIDRSGHDDFSIPGTNIPVKMSKSAGTFITLQTLKETTHNGGKINPLAFRYLVLGTHYRKKLNFSWDALYVAQNIIDKLHALAGELGEPGVGCAEYEQKFQDAINDDLNTPQALAVLWDMLIRSDNPRSAKKASLLKFDKVLGLKLQEATPIPTFTISSMVVDDEQSIATTTTPTPDELKKDVEQLLNKRLKLKKSKKWDEADDIRKQIEQKNFKIQDKK